MPFKSGASVRRREAEGGLRGGWRGLKNIKIPTEDKAFSSNWTNLTPHLVNVRSECLLLKLKEEFLSELLC